MRGQDTFAFVGLSEMTNRPVLILASLSLFWCSQPSPVLAQTSPGLPEPTVEQAKTFITETVEQHGRSAEDEFESSYLLQLAGDRGVVQWTFAYQEKSGSQHSRQITRRSFLLREVSFSDSDKSPLQVMISCKSDAPCINETTDKSDNRRLDKVPDSSTPSGFNFKMGEQTFPTSHATRSSAGVLLNDASLVPRVIKALQFYQSHLPAAAASPF